MTAVQEAAGPATEPQTEDQTTASARRKQLERLEMRARCVRTDLGQDPVRATREHMRTILPLRSELQSLRIRRATAPQQLASYRKRVAELEDALRLGDESARAREMIRLIREVNGLVGGEVAELESELARSQLGDLVVTKSRTADLRGILRGLRGEIIRLESLSKPDGEFERREAELVALIGRWGLVWDDFVKCHYTGYDELDVLNSEISSLRMTLHNAEVSEDTQALVRKLAEALLIMTEGFSPEQAEYVARKLREERGEEQANGEAR